MSPAGVGGALPFPLQPLTPHSLSRRVRDLLAGDQGAHRDLPVDQDDSAEQEKPRVVPEAPRPVYSRHNRQTAWSKRGTDLEDLTGVHDQLDDVDRKVNELNRRALAMLDIEAAAATNRKVYVT